VKIVDGKPFNANARIKIESLEVRKGGLPPLKYGHVGL
jgi:hypothetical protein